MTRAFCRSRNARNERRARVPSVHAFFLHVVSVHANKMAEPRKVMWTERVRTVGEF